MKNTTVLLELNIAHGCKDELVDIVNRVKEEIKTECHVNSVVDSTSLLVEHKELKEHYECAVLSAK